MSIDPALFRQPDALCIPLPKNAAAFPDTIVAFVERAGASVPSRPVPLRYLTAYFSRKAQTFGLSVSDLVNELHAAGRVEVFAFASGARFVFSRALIANLVQGAEDDVRDDPENAGMSETLVILKMDALVRERKIMLSRQASQRPKAIPEVSL